MIKMVIEETDKVFFAQMQQQYPDVIKIISKRQFNGQTELHDVIVAATAVTATLIVNIFTQIVSYYKEKKLKPYFSIKITVTSDGKKEITYEASSYEEVDFDRMLKKICNHLDEIKEVE